MSRVRLLFTPANHDVTKITKLTQSLRTSWPSCFRGLRLRRRRHAGIETLLARGADALGEPANPIVDFRWREGAEWQPHEPLPAPVRKKGEAVREVETLFGGLRAHGCREYSLGEGERDEEAAVGARREAIGHVGVETRQTGIQAWGVEIGRAHV